MSELNDELPNLIDRSVKALFRECPTVVMRLAGMEVAPEAVRVEDPNLNLPELRADHVFILPTQDGQLCAVYLEYQLEPNANLLPSWCAKWGGLSRQLGMPVVLLVLYLEQGDRATFPDRYEVEVGAIKTTLVFTAIRLWEHADRIRSGELPELAPLLVLCEKSPTERTVEEEIAVIRRAALSEETEEELLGLVLLVGLRYFARESLLPLFRKEEEMTRGRETLLYALREIGILEEWKAEGKAEGMAEGIEEGEAKGKAEAAREMTLRFLGKRFGELPEALVQRIATSDAAWCQNLFDQAIGAQSLEELSWDAEDAP